jgi:transposase InsO family protein
MPWKETCVLKERLKFVVACLESEVPIVELCRAFGVSRKTAYKYITRFREEGANGLNDHSRAPHVHPNATNASAVDKLIKARKKHPNWGARKLMAYLARREAKTQWPASSTAYDIIKRAGLVQPRVRRRHATPTSAPLSHADKPNAVWCTDFKGWFRTGDGERCDPLTLTDGFSRYLLSCKAVAATDGEHARPIFERVFRTFGLPDAIRSDNGPPFATTGVGGLSRLNVWWVRLGIRIEHITPGSPQENGRHERMHLTLKLDTTLPPQRSLFAQQKSFDRFRREYNEERPHEALANRTPADLYHSSTRQYPSELPEIIYPQHFEVRSVHHSGTVRWQSSEVYLGEALAGERIGLEQLDETYWRVHFGPYALALADTRTRKVLRYKKLRLAVMRS